MVRGHCCDLNPDNCIDCRQDGGTDLSICRVDGFDCDSTEVWKGGITCGGCLGGCPVDTFKTQMTNCRDRTISPVGRD